MPRQGDPLRVGLQLALYIFLYIAAAMVLSPLLTWVGDYLVGIVATGLLAAFFANWLVMRIHERKSLLAIGLGWTRGSAWNVGLGVAGGMGAAVLVLALPLAVGAAHMRDIPGSNPSLGSFLFVTAILLCGAAGEEILFRGYGFQVLLRYLGAASTILPVGVLFAALHSGNPNASTLGLVNTAGFGILFGYAFLRSRDLWLPIGMHFGWNFTLPLFGVNVSGLKIEVTGYGMEWAAGKLWSGGEYGPEASILSSVVLVLLAVYVWKAPIRRQASALLDPAVEESECAPGPSS